MEPTQESSWKPRSFSALAPKVSPAASSPRGLDLDSAVLKPKSCLACRRRKVKCDRQVPCANCCRWSIDCFFPSPVRHCSRPRKKPQARSPSHEDLYSRIHALESQVLDLTETIDVQANKLQPPAPPGIPLFPSSGGWSHAVSPLHPSLTVAQAFWQVFLDRVDPLIKVVHRPTVDQIFRRVMHSPTSLGEGQEALLLAIYLACISAMRPVDVQARLRMSKPTALSTYRRAVEQALMRAGFITTNDWTTIQALVLFISGSRFQDEKNAAWTLAGLARRLDSSVSEHSPPFEREMRRRLWWHLWYLDQRRGDDRGRDAGTLNNLDTGPIALEMPLNCHDFELGSGMTEPAPVQPGWTEMSFCLLQYDLATTRQIVESDIPRLDKIRTLKDCQHRIQSKYLRHCDGTQPIHWLASHVSHVIISEIWMNLLGPRLASFSLLEPSEQALRDQLFLTAIDILDTQRRLEREPAARHWEWLLSAYFQYVPLTFLLNELCWRRHEPLVGYAWEIAEKAFQRWPEDARRSVHGVMLTELRLHAISIRQQEIELESFEAYYLASDSQIALGGLSASPASVGIGLLDEVQVGLGPSFVEILDRDASVLGIDFSQFS